MTQPIRIGIAGLGRAGWGMHCRELAGKEDLFQIVAACDVLPLAFGVQKRVVSLSKGSLSMNPEMSTEATNLPL